MDISVDPSTCVITILQSELTPEGGSLYSLDTNAFRLALKAWEYSEEGIVKLVTHIHNTEVSVAGTTFARTIEILPPYSVTFEDPQYTVLLEGSNNNIFDVASGILNQNQVQIISTNSAGLITTISGSGVTEQDKTDIIDGVWDEATSGHSSVGTFGEAITDVVAEQFGLTPTEATQLLELYKLAGLMLTKPMTVTPTSRVVDDIDLEITGDGETISTVTRQP